MQTKRSGGFTLAEILIVVSLIAILSSAGVVVGKYQTQIKKGKDAKRKADLTVLQKTLEEYYEDKAHYPEKLSCGSDILKPYLASIPCDPNPNMSYEYIIDPDNPTQSQWYIIFAKLEYKDDPIIEKRACKDGCVIGDTVYNYLVTSPNFATSVLATIIPTIAPPPGPSPTPSPTATPPPDLSPTPLPTTTPTPTPELTCPEGMTPRLWDPVVYGDCENPAAYCPPQGNTGCCASGTLWCTDGNYWCCEPTSSLFWEAEDGVITFPFIVREGYVYQFITTKNPLLGGRASYRFNLATSGDYIVRAVVDAPDDGSDSFFVNIDSEPTTSMDWHIPITNGFEERTVTWGGSPSPQVFTLSAGEHELIFRGREANTKLDRLEVVNYE